MLRKSVGLLKLSCALPPTMDFQKFLFYLYVNFTLEEVLVATFEINISPMRDNMRDNSPLKDMHQCTYPFL